LPYVLAEIGNTELSAQLGAGEVAEAQPLVEVGRLQRFEDRSDLKVVAG
jgi:hypothetical protein